MKRLFLALCAAAILATATTSATAKGLFKD